MNDEDQERMREWVRNNGKSVRQSVRKKATNRGKIHFAIPSAHDLDETQLDETCPNCAGDHEENQVDEYSDGSDSSDSEMDIDDEIENDLTFLRSTRSGRSITINRSLF